MERQVTTLQGAPAEVLSQLQVTRARDAVGDQERKLVGAKRTLLFLLGFVGLVGSIFLFTVLPLVGVLGLLIAIGLIVYGCVLQSRYGKLEAVDLDNERLQLVQELLEALSPDLSDKKPITLTLRHGDCFKYGAVASQRAEGGLFTGRVNISQREDAWMALGGRMMDGNLFRLSVTEVGKRKSKSKRKYTKVLDRITEKVSLVLRVSPEIYPHLERLQPALHPERLRAGAGLEPARMEVHGQNVRLAAETGPHIRQQLRSTRPESGLENKLNASKLVGLLAFLYAGLSYCRPEAAPAPGAPAAQPGPPSGSPPGFLLPGTGGTSGPAGA